MISLAAAGVGLGLVFAAQIGPVTLLIVRSVLRGGRAYAVALAMATGVAMVDLLYAAVGLAGVGRLLAHNAAEVVFGCASAALLVVVGTRTAWAGLRARTGFELDEDVVAPRPAFVTAVAATALNPLTIALWTVAFPAAVPAAATRSVGSGIAVIAGVAVGTLTWYCGFATLIATLRRFVGTRAVRLLDVLIGLGVVGFGGFVAYRTAADR